MQNFSRRNFFKGSLLGATFLTPAAGSAATYKPTPSNNWLGSNHVLAQFSPENQEIVQFDTNSFGLGVAETIKEITEQQEVFSIEDFGPLRDPEAAEEFRKLVSLLSSADITNENDLSEALNADYRGIEEGFEYFEPKDQRYLNPLHLEELLAQAADFLQQAYAYQQEWDALSEKWTKVLLESFEYIDLDEIHTKEVEAGRYDTVPRLAWANYTSEQINQKFHEFMEVALEQHYETVLSDEPSEALKTAVRNAAWVSSRPPYSWEDQFFGEYIEYSLGTPVFRNVSDINFEAADHSTAHSIADRRIGVRSQIFLHGAQALAAKNKADALKFNFEWEKYNRDSKIERSKAARKYQDLKLKLALLPEGSLNSAKRLKDIKGRFQDELNFAISRMKAAEAGLENVFNVTNSITDAGIVQPEILEVYTRWIKFQRNFLRAINQSDQSTFIPVSLKDVLGDDGWSGGLAAKKWEFDLIEFIPSVIPLEMRDIRMRGVSVFLDSSAPETVLSLKVTPPTDVVIRPSAEDPRRVEHEMMKPLRIGRVEKRQPQRVPDLYGVESLYNGSPLGKWTVELLEGFEASSVEGLQDIVIDVFFAYQMVDP